MLTTSEGNKDTIESASSTATIKALSNKRTIVSVAIGNKTWIQQRQETNQQPFVYHQIKTKTMLQKPTSSKLTTCEEEKKLKGNIN